MTFLDFFNLLTCDFTQNRSGGKIIKFHQSQALTSHFESFWSIVGGLNYIHLANINFYVKLEAEADAFFYKRIFPISLLALSSLNKSLPNLKGFYITELLSKYKKKFFLSN